MKPVSIFKQKRAHYLMCMLVVFGISSCNKFTVPSDYVGNWNSPETKVVVRTSEGKLKYNFTSDSVNVTLKINANKEVSGTIGNVVFTNGKLLKNKGLPPSVTGIAYIVQCGEIGKIFENDPLPQKEVELWLSPIVHSDTINAELRFTERNATFPMSGFSLSKSKTYKD